MPIAVSLIKKHRGKKDWFDLILRDTKAIMGAPNTATIHQIYRKYKLKPLTRAGKRAMKRLK